MTGIVSKEFERDNRNNALINTNLESYNKYKETKLQSRRINKIEGEISEMKEMLVKILDRIETNGN
jgi:hypothetical protein